MKHNSLKRTVPFAAFAGLAALVTPCAYAQVPTIVGPLQIGGSARPPAHLPGNNSGLLLGATGFTGFQWIQSYNGPLILNGNGVGECVGIGLTNPLWTLDVAGTIHAVGGGPNFTSAGVMGESVSSPGIIGTSTLDVGVMGASANSFGVVGRGVFGMRATGTQVGITAICSDPLHGLAGSFRGNVTVSGNITYTGALNRSSDARYKTEVKPLGSALQTVESLHGVTYRYKRSAFPDKNFPATRQVGFIAQEVQSVLPQLVSKDQNGYLSVDYVQVVPVLVEAIKEQQKQIEVLTQQKRRLNALEARLTELTAQLAHTKPLSHTKQVARK